MPSGASPSLGSWLSFNITLGAMDLTWMIKYAVQAGSSLIIPFIWLLPVTVLGATESGVNRRVISIVTIVSVLVDQEGYNKHFHIKCIEYYEKFDSL